MNTRSFLFLPAMALPAAATGPGTPGILATTSIANLLVAITLVFLFIFGMFAYASLARFAPYRDWIYLYLVSFAGIVCALFLLGNGGSAADAAFVLITVTGLNLIVHVLRFDRIELGVPNVSRVPA